MSVMRPLFTIPPRLVPGDRVAVVSPSFAAPGQYPAGHALAMRRLREEFRLEPVEYPTTRRLDASPRDRAADLMAAFADPGIRAVLATIGGGDQITVLPLTVAPPAQPGAGWLWYQPDRLVTGPTWGGNLEILHWNLAANRWIRPAADYAGCVLLLETSEETPPAGEVFRMLRNFGERGLLAQFPAILVGRPKAGGLFHPASPDERQRYRDEQQAAVLRALAAYNPGAMVVFGIDFGHTDPQWVLPYGGTITVDGPARRVTAHY